MIFASFVLVLLAMCIFALVYHIAEKTQHYKLEMFAAIATSLCALTAFILFIIGVVTLCVKYLP